MRLDGGVGRERVGSWQGTVSSRQQTVDRSLCFVCFATDIRVENVHEKEKDKRHSKAPWHPIGEDFGCTFVLVILNVPCQDFIYALCVSY
jgi:hypothetical protein